MPTDPVHRDSGSAGTGAPGSAPGEPAPGAAVHIDSLTRMAQDYLRTIFKVQEYEPAPVSINELAMRMGVAASTASGNVRKLVADGLVQQQPYGGAELTAAGRAAAVQMARRHRLLETFLVERLGYSWDEVHDEAEDLEHAASDLFIQRIEADLGFPTHDPHGDPIPDRDGQMVTTAATPLTDVAPAACGTVTRISDDDPSVLRYLTGHGVQVGTHLQVLEWQDGAGVVSVALTRGPVLDEEQSSNRSPAPAANGRDDDGASAGAQPSAGAGGTEGGAMAGVDLGLAAAEAIWLTADAHPTSVTP